MVCKIERLLDSRLPIQGCVTFIILWCVKWCQQQHFPLETLIFVQQNCAALAGFCEQNYVSVLQIHPSLSHFYELLFRMGNVTIC